MAWPNDTYWLCVETNFDIDKLSPNNGWPQCIISAAKPDYIRVLGPYQDELFNDKLNGPVFGEDECAKDNIIIYNNRYKDGKDNPANWTTKGYYAFCPYNVIKPSVVVELRDLPPTKTQVSKCIGPFYTKKDAIEASIKWDCKIAFTPAIDVCSPYVVNSPYPDLECSLVCALGWPMMEGSVILDLFQNADPSSGKTIEPSYCLSKMSMALSCEPTFEPSVSRCWKSSFVSDQRSIFYLIKDPPRGYELRLSGTMCIDADPNFANVSISMQALMIDKDVNPDNPNPSEGSRWITVGSLGGRLPALGPSRNKKEMRIYSGPIIPFHPSNGLYDFCFQYVKITVQLRPWVFGCDGSAGENGTGTKIEKTCGLYSAEKAYSCASVQVLPINNQILDVDNISPRPNFYQLGLNANTSAFYPGESYLTGCLYCENLRNRDNDWECSPNPTLYSIKELISMGIDGEQNADFQQIQLVGTYIGTIGLKRISYAGLYLILKPSSYGGHATEVTNQKMVALNRSWKIDQWVGYKLQMFIKNTEYPYDDLETFTNILGNNENTLFISGWPQGNIPKVDINATAKYQIVFASGSGFMYKPILAENIIQHRQPMIIEYVLPEFNARVLFYMLEFPSAEIAGCIDVNDYPELPTTTTGDPNLFLSMPPPIFPAKMLEQDEKKLNEIQNLQKQLENMNKVCIYLGNAIPNTKACCGASPSFECEKHGRCKQYGVAGAEDNMVCSSCPDFS